MLAAVLFAAASVFRGDDRPVVEIDAGRVAATVAEIETVRGAPLTAAQRDTVERALIDEELLVREALARGLVQDDPELRNVLAQRMLHVLSADVIQPTEAELVAHYQANRERYRTLGSVTVEEIVLPAGVLSPSVRQGLAEGRSAEEIGAGSPRRLELASLEDLTNLFGPEIARRVFAGGAAWVGPHATVRGDHWFRVVERDDPGEIPLDEVREQVRLDWIAAEEVVRLEARLAELRERYRVVIGGEPE